MLTIGISSFVTEDAPQLKELIRMAYENFSGESLASEDVAILHNSLLEWQMELSVYNMNKFLIAFKKLFDEKFNKQVLQTPLLPSEVFEKVDVDKKVEDLEISDAKGELLERLSSIAAKTFVPEDNDGLGESVIDVVNKNLPPPHTQALHGIVRTTYNDNPVKVRGTRLNVSFEDEAHGNFKPDTVK